MALKVLELFTLKNILCGLSEFGKDGFKLRTITEFIFKPYVQDLIKILTSNLTQRKAIVLIRAKCS